MSRLGEPATPVGTDRLSIRWSERAQARVAQLLR